MRAPYPESLRRSQPFRDTWESNRGHAALRWIVILAACCLAAWLGSRVGGSAQEPLDPRTPEADSASVASEALVSLSGDALRVEPVPPEPRPWAPIENSSSDWTVRTVDSQGAPVAGVPVIARRGARTWDLGTSDSSGEVGLAVDASSRFLLVGCDDDWRGSRLVEAAELATDEPSDRVLDLQLSPAGHATGQLVDTRGQSVGPGVLVVAMPYFHAQPDASRVEDLRARTHDAPSARTDEGGRFELNGLDPKERYTLWGAGAGWVLADESAAEVLAGQHLVRRADPMWAVALELRDDLGEPARVPLDLVSRGAERAEFLGPPLEAWPLESNAALWNGLGALREELPPNVRLFAFSGGNPESQETPFVYQALFPGYESASRQVRAARVGQGQLPRERVTLSRRAQQFGEFELMHLDSQGGLSPIPSGELVLFDENQVFNLWVPATPEGSLRLGPVPFGRYGFRFRSEDGISQSVEPPEGVPTELLVVGPDPSLATIELGAGGSVEIEVNLLDGRPHWGSLSVLIGEPGSVWFDEDGAIEWTGVHRVHFSGPPYRIDHLPSGFFRFVLDSPFQIEIEGGRDLQVIPDQLQLVRLQASN